MPEAFKEAQEQSSAEAKRQKQCNDRKAHAILLEPGDLVLAKANTYKWKRKVKDWWEEEPYKVVFQVTKDVPQTGCPWVLHQNWLFLIAPVEGTPLCMVIWAEWAGCAATSLEEQAPDRSETEKVPQSADCLPPAQLRQQSLL